MSEEFQTREVPPDARGVRLDAFVAQQASLSRSQAEKLIQQGKVQVNGKSARAGLHLEPGMRVRIPTAAPPPPLSATPRPEAIPLHILFEDASIIVVDKPPGLAVHPGAGRAAGTLVNALLAHTPNLSGGEHFRPGIVHRLDRDTSGVMVVAKTPQAFTSLSRQVRNRELDRRYLALVWGRMREDRLLIDVPIARHRTERKRMAAVVTPEPERSVRTAVTDVRVQERFAHLTLVEVKLETGRTHQIRVHLAHQGYPVVGDPVYGLRQARRREVEVEEALRRLIRDLPGQALHAHTLTFRHPLTGQEVTFSTSPPPEMARLLVYLHKSVL